MSKSNADQIRKRTERQLKNTSSGGHLGGTYFGQSADGKTTSTTAKTGPKARRNNGSHSSV